MLGTYVNSTKEHKWASSYLIIGFWTLIVQLSLSPSNSQFLTICPWFHETNRVFEGCSTKAGKCGPRSLFWCGFIIQRIGLRDFKGTFAGLTPRFHRKIQVVQLRFPSNQSEVWDTALHTLVRFDHPGSNVPRWGSIPCSWWIEAFWRSPSTSTT